ELTGRVVDQAGLLDPVQEAELTAKLAALETQSNRQLVVATVNSLEGYDIADYGYQLGRTWGIGQDGDGEKEKDNGLILLVAPNERKVRVEVGYGLEGIMTDALSSIIIQNDILPQFRNDNMAGGIIAGVDRIASQLVLPEEEARLIAQDAEQQASEGDGENIGLMIFWGFILIFFVIIPMFSNRGGKRYRRGAGPVVIWGGGTGFGGGSSGGFGGGGFGGGGFGGGGGSFGGGGASGGW
ncbi:YgcG family protein, partial [Parasphingorhabdus sp.]|uniref:TPM domain-containing protein n=1 Tax=Parasphingorhabdus sp. TaxID=2709688 RepID=UPI00359472F9